MGRVEYHLYLIPRNKASEVVVTGFVACWSGSPPQVRRSVTSHRSLPGSRRYASRLRWLPSRRGANA